MPSLRPVRGSSSRSRVRRALRTDTETSARLSRIRQHGTSAELEVRRIVYGLGRRFRVHNRDLPGSPDLANRSRRWAIYVHGCFWHGHRGCQRATVPKRNREFWLDKFEANRARDRRVRRELARMGYATMTIWECEIERTDILAYRLIRFFEGIFRES